MGRQGVADTGSVPLGLTFCPWWEWTCCSLRYLLAMSWAVFPCHTPPPWCSASPPTQSCGGGQPWTDSLKPWARMHFFSSTLSLSRVFVTAMQSWLKHLPTGNWMHKDQKFMKKKIKQVWAFALVLTTDLFIHQLNVYLRAYRVPSTVTDTAGRQTHRSRHLCFFPDRCCIAWGKRL